MTFIRHFFLGLVIVTLTAVICTIAYFNFTLLMWIGDTQYWYLGFVLGFCELSVIFALFCRGEL